MPIWMPPIIAFLLGSIPFGLLIAKSQGVNIREHGSGNIGATNVLRVVGKKYGITCFVLDFFKGLIPTFIAINFIRFDQPADVVAKNFMLLPSLQDHASILSQINAQGLHILTGLCAVMGHNYSPWVSFKGGKGVATSAGVITALAPFGLLILGFIWFVSFKLTRYVSVASILASVSLPFVVIYGSWRHGKLANDTWNKPLLAFAIFIALMSVWKHRSNIVKLMNGTENRFTPKSKKS